MKRIPIFLLLIFLIPLVASAQKKVKEKDVIGTWKLVIEIDEDDEDDEDIEDRDVDESFLGHVLASGIKALVFNIMDEIDIQFEFRKDGTMEVYAMDELEDDDENRWYINSSGELIIKDEDDRDDDDDDVWLLKDGYLQAYEKRGSRLKEKDVYLKKVDN